MVIKCIPCLDEHLKSTVVEIRCFYYLYNNSIGIIDLILEYNSHIDIIDYKTKNVVDEAYINQLTGYKNYIESIIQKEVNTYLYSIVDDKLERITVSVEFI